MHLKLKERYAKMNQKVQNGCPSGIYYHAPATYTHLDAYKIYTYKMSLVVEKGRFK